MFRLLKEAVGDRVTLFIDGEATTAHAGETVAAVLLRTFPNFARQTSISGARRSPFCMMGCCFECIVEIDGSGRTRGCMTSVRDGMRVVRPNGLPEVGHNDAGR
jgi:predicted molibdopterin-dependent oxidoreductase YjgC